MADGHHTPGPWFNGIQYTTLTPSGNEMFCNDAKFVFRTEQTLDGKRPPIIAVCDTEATARLIAAAPELLAIAQSLVANERQLNDEHFSGVQERFMEMARAAIAKATGAP